MRALIIEDDSNIAEAVSLCFQLRWDGILATIATEGRKGVESALTGNYDFITLDLNLPDIDGFEVLRRIRKYSNTPVIIVSVRSSPEDQKKGKSLGANDYIVKPFKPEELVARVSALLKSKDTKPNA